MTQDDDEPTPAGRVLIVARELTRGGAAYLALRHARRLAAEFPVDVLVTGPCDDAFLAEFPPGVGIDRLEEPAFRPEGPPLEFLEDFALIHQEMPPFRRRYRAVLATSILPDWVSCAATAAVRADRRLICIVDEALAHYPRIAPGERAIVERCILGAEWILPVSRRLWHRLAEDCPPLRDRPWQVLRPPVEVEAMLAQAEEPQAAVVRGDRPVVLTVARLTPDKQVALCLRVHHQLKAAGLEFRWSVIGAGPEEPALRAEIGRLGMVDDFLILPPQENVFACMKACDVFALFSTSEGCPTVVLEALLLGCPVVMTDVHGSDELIDSGRTGLVVAHDESAIAEGLTRILRDGALRRRFRDALAAAPLAPAMLRENRTVTDLIAADTPSPPSPGSRA